MTLSITVGALDVCTTILGAMIGVVAYLTSFLSFKLCWLFVEFLHIEGRSFDKYRCLPIRCTCLLFMALRNGIYFVDSRERI